MAFVALDVFYPVPESWGVCLSCEMVMAQADLGEAPQVRGLEEYPPEYLEDFHRLSAILISLADRYQSSIAIRIWDPRSLQGLLKSIRYGVHRYPTFLINQRAKVTGWDQAIVEQHLQAAGITPLSSDQGAQGNELH